MKYYYEYKYKSGRTIGGHNLEKIIIKDGKITGNWGNGNYYCYTLSSPQAVIVNKLNER